MQQEINFTGQQLKEIGMQRASDKAEKENPGWNEAAYEMLKQFLEIRFHPFLMEDFRAYAEPSGLPSPPTGRAYGSVAVKAAKNGLMRRIGYTQVTNPIAHRANASVWLRNQ